MNDVVLVHPSIALVSGGPYVPGGILSIASFLVDRGYRVKIIDENVGDNVEQELIKSLKDPVICVGISTMTGPQIRNALRASETVRKIDPNVTIVWGGIHASLLPEQTIRNSRVDVVVRGEGEETLLEMATCLEGGRPLGGVKGITFKEKGKVVSTPPREFLDLDSLPPINYELINLKRYFSFLGGRKRAVSIWTSKGCPYRCAFCYNTVFNKQLWRWKKAEKVVEEIEMLVNDYGIDGLFINDDNFFVNKKRAEGICRGIKKFSLLCQTECRIDRLLQFDSGFLTLMAESGIKILGLGAESGSQRILDLIKKDLKVGQVLESARVCKKYGLTPFYSFMMGFPWENQSDLEATLDAIDHIREINPEARIWTPVFVPYPGTELYDLCLREGIRLPSSLEEWSTFIWRDISGGFRSWVANPDMIETIMIASTFFLERFKDRSALIRRERGSQWVKLLFRLGGQHLLRQVEGFRWKRRFWGFPVEAKVMRALSSFHSADYQKDTSKRDKN
jgi:radical SAM superfamily enzyme YgiQ (UPF0313 family)